MNTTSPYLIVGAGLSGLLAAKILSKNGIDFVGLEKTDRLGGQVVTGHQRIYEASSLQLLEENLSSIDWIRVDEPAQERKKGAWLAAELDVSEEERWYLGAPFYAPRDRFAAIVDKMVEDVGSRFQLQKEVVAISPEKKTVTCQDGSEFGYGKIIWCTDLYAAMKVWEGEKPLPAKRGKGAKEVPGGINLDWELEKHFFSSRNTIVFPFRYKEKKLRALGTEESGPSDKALVHWVVFLDEDIVEDREEVAKCVRALKRELHKEFPELKDITRSERIVYQSSFFSDTTSAIESLEVLPDVIYAGAQARLKESKEGLAHVDRALENLRHLEDSLRR